MDRMTDNNKADKGSVIAFMCFLFTVLSQVGIFFGFEDIVCGYLQNNEAP
jgi:hypothetical protein